MRSLTAILLVLVLVTSAAVAAVREVDATPIASESRFSIVSAHGEWVVWSHFDEERGQYELVGRKGSAAPRPLGVRPRSLPFDVNLGPDARGRTVGVYSRCAREAVPSPPFDRPPFDRLPPYRLGRRCRIYQLDLESGRERLLLSRPGASLVQPAIWRDHLVFVSQRPRTEERVVVHIEERFLRGGKLVTRRVVAGPEPFDEDEGPLGIDVEGGTVAYAWRSGSIVSCPHASVGRSEIERTRVVVRRRGGSRAIVARGCDADGPGRVDVAIVDSPSLSGRNVFWRADIRTPGREGVELRSRELDSRRRGVTRFSGLYMQFVSVHRGRAFVSDPRRGIFEGRAPVPGRDP